jgi:hypothetical protein
MHLLVLVHLQKQRYIAASALRAKRSRTCTKSGDMSLLPHCTTSMTTPTPPTTHTYTHAPATPTPLCLPTHNGNDMCISPSPLSFTPAPIPHPRDIPNTNQQGDHTCTAYNTAEPTHTHSVTLKSPKPTLHCSSSEISNPCLRSGDMNPMDTSVISMRCTKPMGSHATPSPAPDHSDPTSNPLLLPTPPLIHISKHSAATIITEYRVALHLCRDCRTTRRSAGSNKL